MRSLQRISRGEFTLNRTEAFSDAVFAIIVTLLVLELKVPALKDVTSIDELGRALIDQAPKFVSWLISFIIVCKFWLNHHHLLGLARHAQLRHDVAQLVYSCSASRSSRSRPRSPANIRTTRWR